MTQIYEKYWQLTLAYTDFNGKNFLDALRACIDFIDVNDCSVYSPELYMELQKAVTRYAGIEGASVRKAINQFVKLGFVKPFLAGYHDLAKDYLSARTLRERKILLSKIVYSSASFESSITSVAKGQEINFLIRTLEHNGSLSRNEVIALMRVDLSDNRSGYMTRSELESCYRAAESSGFIERKYNQVSYFWNLLGKLEGLRVSNDRLYMDAEDVQETETLPETGISFRKNKRDPYLQRLYKLQLEDESMAVYGRKCCMVENLPYPVLIASHIKPFACCNMAEAYNVNNGFLLSKNIDSLFDLGYITFKDDGSLAFSDVLDSGLREAMGRMRLDPVFLNPSRLRFLSYHRSNVFCKRYKAAKTVEDCGME